MRLVTSEEKPWVSVAAEKIWDHRVSRFLVIPLFTCVFIALGAYIQRTGVWGETVKPLLRENVSLIPKVTRGWLSQPEHITIDIKHKNYMKLVEKRNEALASGTLASSSEDYVPAKIRHGDQTIDIKLRLKGDMRDHWEGDKWSFRIVVKGEHTLFGMKQFSIQHPKTRGYIYEWLYHQALKREDVLSLRYDFINVTLNGKDLGIYAVEEHFEKRLIEHQQRREGPIVRFNEDLMWAELAQQNYLPAWQKRVTGSGSYFSSDVDVFQSNKWLSEPGMYPQYVKAVQLLESFRRGTLKVSEVFDVPKLARYFAIADLMGAVHGATNWHNARFYYNPVTSRLEPIGFDAFDGEPVSIKSLVAENLYTPEREDGHLYIAEFFADRQFYGEYLRQLERMAEPSYLKSLLSEVKVEMDKSLGAIYREFPEFDFSDDVFIRNQRYIHMVLNPVKGLHAYYHEVEKNRVILELANIQYLPLEVMNVSYKDMLLPATEETVLPGKRPSQPVEYQKVAFTLPEGMVWSKEMGSDLKVNYKILGTSQARSETVFPWPRLSEDFVENDFIRKAPNARQFDFLVINESTKEMLIRPGTWNLTQSVIIPQGYRVVCGEGTKLNLSNSATILSYSPLEFRGSEDDPIIVQSPDSTGQGIVVMKAGQASVLEYVIFDSLSNPSQHGWQLTGGVNFYESPVTVSHCQFLHSRSEDALNIIRSEFTMDGTLFKQTAADAFDVDFTKGRITHSSFVACGNDGVDASGSVIELEDVFVDGAGDKGISIGEGSQAALSRINIKNTEIAIASKDRSDITIENIKITDSKIGFAAYQKKPEYGAASIKVRRLDMGKMEIPYLIEDQSSMTLNGAVISSSRKNVKDILYGVEYGKSSK